MEQVVAPDAPSPEASVEYKAVLDDMVDAMNLPGEAAKPVASTVPRKLKRAKPAEQSAVVFRPS